MNSNIAASLMARTSRVQGLLVAMVTPFDVDNRVDYASLKGLIDFHVSAGHDGLVIAGTTGEAATLTKSEHAELIASVCRDG